MQEEIRLIIEENNRRNAEVYARFDPIGGFGSVGERKGLYRGLSDTHPIPACRNDGCTACSATCRMWLCQGILAGTWKCQ